jgi:Flp pilus assembly protein TadD
MTPGDRPVQSAGQAAATRTSSRLDSWKEIAGFFRREVRTVQLWERHEDLPVHRHLHRKVSTVHAYPSELRAWWEKRCQQQQVAKPVAQTSAKTATARDSAYISVAVQPFHSEAGLFPGLTTRQLSARIADRLDTLLPPRIRISSSMHVAPRHGTEERDRQTDADFYLQGKLRPHAEGIQVEMRITRGRDQSEVWSYVHSQRQCNLGELDMQLADKAARALSHHVLLSRHVALPSTINPAARYAYLRGRYLWSLRSSPSSIFKAMEQFQLATVLDPAYARAYSGLADCYVVLGWFGTLPREIVMREAREAAQKALSLDGTLAEAHASMGCIHLDFDWEWENAERELLLGMQSNPSYTQAYCWYGLLLTALGRSKEAVQVVQIAQDIDPASPMVGLFLGDALLHSGQYHAAIQQLHHVLHLSPNHPVAQCKLGIAYEMAGDLLPALSHLQIAFDASTNDPNVQSMLAYVYARAGKKTDAEALMGRVRLLEHQQPIPAIDAAAAFTALGDRELAFRYLQLGYEQRNARLTTFANDPRLAPLRGDPRFASLARLMRLA